MRRSPAGHFSFPIERGTCFAHFGRERLARKMKLIKILVLAAAAGAVLALRGDAHVARKKRR